QRYPPSFNSHSLESMQSRHNQLPTSGEPDPAANSSRTRPAYPCFFVAEMPPVQRQTSAACASIILCALSCQSCTRSLPACAPAPVSGLPLLPLTMLNQPCQSSRSASAQCCNCSRPLRASSRSSSGVPLALARVSVHCRVHSARASNVSFTEDCQASTVFVQSSSVGVPPSFRKVSSQSVSSFCCDSAQVFNRLSFVFLSLIDPFSFHRSCVRNAEIVIFVCQHRSGSVNQKLAVKPLVYATVLVWS